MVTLFCSPSVLEHYLSAIGNTAAFKSSAYPTNDVSVISVSSAHVTLKWFSFSRQYKITSVHPNHPSQSDDIFPFIHPTKSAFTKDPVTGGGNENTVSENVSQTVSGINHEPKTNNGKIIRESLNGILNTCFVLHRIWNNTDTIGGSSISQSVTSTWDQLQGFRKN